MQETNSIPPVQRAIHTVACGKKGHWAKLSLCGQKGDGPKQKSGKPQTLGAIIAAVGSHKVPNVRVTVGGFVVNGADITAMPDTGADVTVCGLYVLTVLKIDVANLQDSAIPLKAADNHKIGQIGEFTATISCWDFSTEEVIQVIDGTKSLYLSWHASQKLAFVPSDYPTQIMSRDIPDPTRDTFDTTAAATDDEYHDLICLISDGFPHSRQDLPPLMRPYWSVRDQLSIDEDLILCGCRLLIPHPLRREVLRTLHSSHQGTERTKSSAHLAVYWPGINNEIDQVVRGCREYSAELPSQPKEPLQSHDIPERVFQHLCCDLFSYDGNLVVTDVKSGWPNTFNLRQNTSAPVVVNALRNFFQDTAVPTTLYSDNGPRFSPMSSMASCSNRVSNIRHHHHIILDSRSCHWAGRSSALTPSQPTPTKPPSSSKQLNPQAHPPTDSADLTVYFIRFEKCVIFVLSTNIGRDVV